MATLYDDVLNYLAAEGLIDGSTGWAGKAAYMPATPNKLICVFETPGEPPESKKDGSDEQEYDLPGFQIRGRGEAFGYDALRAKMQEIFLALHGSSLSPSSGDPGYVYVFAVQSGPMPMGYDDNSRPGLTWNYRCMRERETT